ncbi:MAG: hypothetical protein V4670_12330 [Bacteroidota bacterium]
MKKVYSISHLLLLGVIIISCKKELAPQESFVDYSTKTTTSPPQNANPNQSTSQQLTTTTSKANPPHGQPGHVCGDGKQQQNTTTQIQSGTNQQYTITQPTTKTVAQNPVKVAKGMNPAHGQPGHVCGIAVGAPLDSKPNTTSTSTTVQNSSTPALLTPANNTANTTQVKVEPGMNPPHGQEGHVCGIAAGAPLNQEKKTEEKKEESPK